MADNETPDGLPEIAQAPGPVIKKPGAVEIGAAPGKLLTPAAKRALREAAERRKAADKALFDASGERAGPKGVEPTRYGDWERGGIAYDF